MLGRTSIIQQASASMRSFSSSSRANNMAKLTLIGRLGAQPQIQKDKQGRDILIYSVAVNDRAPPAKEDGTRPETTSTWYRVLGYNQTPKQVEYLQTIPAGSLVHIEADFKKRTIKNDSGDYSDQTLFLMKNIDVLSKGKGGEAPAAPPASE